MLRSCNKFECLLVKKRKDSLEKLSEEKKEEDRKEVSEYL